MSNIWWAYDESNGSFSALPASPSLLPALGLFFLLAVFDVLGGKKTQIIEKCNGVNLHLHQHQLDKIRYDELLAIQRIRTLTEDEGSELYALVHPPWANSGEVWHY